MKYMISIIGFALVFISCNCVGFSKSVKDIMRDNKPSVLLLTFEEGSCTGFVVAPEVVMTAGHCVKDLQHTMYATDTEENEYAAFPITDNDELDIALLSVPGLTLSPLKLADKEPVLGERLMTVGYPGYAKGLMVFEVGYLKSLTKKYLFSDDIAFAGESGGPVFNEVGQVVGVLVGSSPKMHIFEGILHSHKDISYIVNMQQAVLEMKVLNARGK